MGQGSAAALARWTLVSVPPDAVLLAENETDTGALRALQAAGLRPDVRVVRAIDEPGLAATWATSARPVVGTLTLDPEVFGRVAPMTVSAGAYTAPRPRRRAAVRPRRRRSDGRLASAAPTSPVRPTASWISAASSCSSCSRRPSRTRRPETDPRPSTPTPAPLRSPETPATADDPLVAIAREWIGDALALPAAASTP